jgi:hypothetical protein
MNQGFQIRVTFLEIVLALVVPVRNTNDAMVVLKVI